MFENWEWTPQNISLLILLFNLVISLPAWRIRRDLRWFELSLVLALAIQEGARIMAEEYGNNLPLLHIYTAFEFFFLSLFYNEVLFKETRFKRIFPCWLIGILLLIIANTVYLQPLQGFNTNAKGLTQVIYIVYAVSYFFYRTVTIISSENKLLNQINASVLIYYSGSFFIFLFAEFLLDSSSSFMHDWFWKINAILYMIYQLMVFLSRGSLVVNYLKSNGKNG